MPLYRPPGPSTALQQAVNGRRTPPPPPARSESSTPPLAEMVKAGVRCESDLVIEPAVLQESTTGQQFTTKARIATVDGVKEVDALLADAGRGSLGVVVRNERDRAIADTVTEKPRSESSVTVTATEEGTSTTPAKDPGVAQYTGDYQPVPQEDLAAINAAIRARNAASFAAYLSSQAGVVEVAGGLGQAEPALSSHPTDTPAAYTDPYALGLGQPDPYEQAEYAGDFVSSGGFGF